MLAYLMRICPNWYAKGTRQPKVSQLQLIVLPVYKQVLWFQVTMQDSAAHSRSQAIPCKPETQELLGTILQMTHHLYAPVCTVSNRILRVHGSVHLSLAHDRSSRWHCCYVTQSCDPLPPRMAVSNA